MKVVLVIAAITMSAAATAGGTSNYCGELKNAHDYTNRESAPYLQTVEAYHFTENVERLITGNSGTLGGELGYTLQRFPNHHRALAALAKLALREKKVRLSGAEWSVECYFNRATRFKPNDAEVRRIYSSYLFKLGRVDEAIGQLIEAVQFEPENGIANYNLGLLYFEKKNYEKALHFARKADSLEVPFQGLKNKLIELGKWHRAPEK